MSQKSIVASLVGALSCHSKVFLGFSREKMAFEMPVEVFLSWAVG